MASSALPRRRTRDEYTDGDSDSDDAESQSSKRLRTSIETTESDDEASERPLLPDTYRRSPKGKERVHSDRGEPHNKHDHLPGSIVRVTLTNFVTYTKAEFHPGPKLNMVIGPNGTGKSTLVCAICIGLGWSTSHLGRAKDVAEFVKHGFKAAEIEIELKADPLRHSHNPVITHRINKDGGNGKSAPKSTYFIDGKKSTAKAANDLAKSFSIQVDNLCQFLPQDRVVEFAALNSVDLLTETQRAAAPDQMVQWHQQLKTWHKEMKQKEKEQQVTLESLKNMEDRQKSQQVEVERLRERDAKKEEKRIFEKLRPFAEYGLCKHRLGEARKHHKLVVKHYRELEAKTQPNLDAIEAKRSYHDRVANHVGHRARMVARGEADAEAKLEKCNKTKSLIEDAEQEIRVEKDGGRADKAKVAELQNTIRKIEHSLQHPPLEFDAEELNSHIWNKRQQSRSIEQEVGTIKQNLENLQEQENQRRQIIHDAQEKKDFLQSQAGKQTSKLEGASRDAARAWRWIQDNRESFKSEVYGPPMIECSLKDVRYADQVETLLGRSELLAFTVTCREDYRMLDHQLHRVLRLSDVCIRSSAKPLATFSPPCSDEQLQHLGLESWLIDLIDGPDAVLAMLCDNADLHRVGFTSSEFTDVHFHHMQNSAIPIVVSASKRYQIFRRREYGDAGTTTKVTEIKKARFLTNGEVNTQEQQEIERSIITAKGELNLIQEQIRDVGQSFKAKKAEADEVTKEQRHLEQDKKDKQSQKTIYDGLQPKLQNARQKLESAQAAVRGLGDRLMAIVDRQDDLCLQMCQEALDYARALESLRKSYGQLLEADIARIEAKSDLEQLEAQNAEEQRLLEEKHVESAQAKEAKDAILHKGRSLEEICKTLGRALTDEEGEIQQLMLDQDWMPEQLENEIAQLQASLEMLVGGNEGMIAEYEKRGRKIEDKRGQLMRIEREMDDVSSRITSIRDKWEPQLDSIVMNISEAFADNFSRIQCAGEVAVHKDDDFEQWAIHIKVKFRENEQLSVLNAHRQSGGERAVSTIFYLMALQSLARAPFRVVDEINQGMDPRNERLVHSRMVEIACAEHTSQYFLITPKLLNNLTYHPNMKVHCIASGEYMPADHKELDFEVLAHKALQIRTTSA